MNMCNFDHNGKCYAPDRLDDDCDRRCQLYDDVPPPVNASHDPPRWWTRLLRLVRRW